MNGTVFKRKLPSGRITWGYSVDVGRDENGKRLRPQKIGFPRQCDAEKALRHKLNEAEAGVIVKPDPTTFASFLDEWFREHAARNCTPKTVERYHELAEYVLPRIGNAKMQDLSSLILERAFNMLKDSGGRDRKTKAPRPLSAKTVRHIAGLVNVALVTAMRWKLLTTNPMDGVVLPKVAKRQGKALDAGQIRSFQDAARAHGVYEFVMLATATGCRRGELLAASWGDVDFVGRVLRISKSLEQTRGELRLKSTKNEEPRVISLPGSAIQMLRDHRSRQAENRRLFGSDYRDDLNLVFCTPEGDYFKPDSITAKICLLARNSGLKGVSLHTLRHSHGSQLLANGVPLPVVSKRLGHSSVYVTATVYSHALSKDETAAAEIWDATVQKSIDAARKTS